MITVTMTAETAAKLREPFKAEEVGKLPRIWCKACRDSGFKKVCGDHRALKCDVCKNKITEAHLHLDYVGHAEITDRLLQVDPSWNWEPVAMTPEGLPMLDREGGLWIRLTLAGVTRMGYGDAEGKKGPSAIKEAIGDALRNAAMRFGVGLDLWGAKFERDAQSTADDSAPQQPAEQAARPATATRQRANGAAAKAAAPTARADELRQAISTAATEEALRTQWLRIEPALKASEISEDEAKQLNGVVRNRKPLVAKVTEKNRSHLHVLWGKAGYGDDRDARLAYTADAVGRTVASWNDLTGAEYQKLATKIQAFIDDIEDAPTGAGVPA